MSTTPKTTVTAANRPSVDPRMEMVSAEGSTFMQESRLPPSGHEVAWIPVLAISPSVFAGLPKDEFEHRLGLVQRCAMALYVQCARDVNEHTGKQYGSKKLKVYVHDSEVSPSSWRDFLSFILSESRTSEQFGAQRSVREVSRLIRKRVKDVGIGIERCSEAWHGRKYRAAFEKIVRSLCSEVGSKPVKGSIAQKTREYIKLEAQHFRKDQGLQIKTRELKKHLDSFFGVDDSSAGGVAVAADTQRVAKSSKAVQLLQGVLRAFFTSAGAPSYFDFMRRILSLDVAQRDENFAEETYYLPRTDLILRLLDGVDLEAKFKDYLTAQSGKREVKRLDFYRYFIDFVREEEYFNKSVVNLTKAVDFALALNELYQLSSEVYRVVDMIAVQNLAFKAQAEVGQPLERLLGQEFGDSYSSSASDSDSADDELESLASLSRSSSGSTSSSSAAREDAALALYYVRFDSSGRTPGEDDVPKSMQHAAIVAVNNPSAVRTAVWLTLVLREFRPNRRLEPGVKAHELPDSEAGLKTLEAYRNRRSRPIPISGSSASSASSVSSASSALSVSSDANPRFSLEDLEFKTKMAALGKARLDEMHAFLAVLGQQECSGEDPAVTEMRNALKQRILVIGSRLLMRSPHSDEGVLSLETAALSAQGIFARQAGQRLCPLGASPDDVRGMALYEGGGAPANTGC